MTKRTNEELLSIITRCAGRILLGTASDSTYSVIRMVLEETGRRVDATRFTIPPTGIDNRGYLTNRHNEALYLDQLARRAFDAMPAASKWEMRDFPIV